jgi:hypothetical protein
MNNIPQEQNKQPILDLLAAQRQFYSDAKFWQAVNIIVVVVIAIILSILVPSYPSLNTCSSVWGIIIPLLDVSFLSPYQKLIQEKAAQIQQEFDCQVLEFNWGNLHCETPVEPESIIRATKRYKQNKSDYSDLENWYPVSIKPLPIHIARIICQRANIRWDASLRRRYGKGVVVALTSLTIIVILIGLVQGQTLKDSALTMIFPLLPIFLLGLRQYKEHNDAANRLDRLRERAETIIEDTLAKRVTPQDVEKASYSLQSQIYDNRRRSPLIFEWIYNRLKSDDEDLMNINAEALVQKFIHNP